MYIKNRNYSEITEKITKSKQDNKKITIILIDLDNFHDILLENKEKIIIETFHFLSKYFPGMTFYLGKDEYAIITDNLKMELIFEVKLNFKIMTGHTFSAGVAIYPKHGEDETEILRALEETLYEAKRTGKNSIFLADQKKMKLKSNYYTPIQLLRLSKLSEKLQRSEASILREALDDLIRKYDL